MPTWVRWMEVVVMVMGRVDVVMGMVRIEMVTVMGRV